MIDRTTVFYSFQASFLYSSGGEMKKASLGLPLIPPIRKAGSLPVGSAAGSPCSSPRLDFQESREMRPRSSSTSQEKTSEHAASSESTTETQRKKEKSSQCKSGPGMPLFPRELTDPFGLEIQVPDPGLGNGGLSSQPAQGALAQEPQEHGSASQKGLPLSQAKETDHPSSAGLTRDKELRASSAKVRGTLCKLAPKSSAWKEMELLVKELKRRQKETSLKLPPETVEPGDAAEATFSLPPVTGTAPSVQRKHPGSAMKKTVVRKQDNVPLLPSTPTLPGDDSFPRNSSGLGEIRVLRQERHLRGSLLG
ncbi:uncharacterized protein LOC119699143 [Motacilla alba alba]|uniref:uncharacterized protein LOC119699143 n=1 Tax=Motacilla alba alba TaxID=1094192 RepID=UPI0018D5933B|nr:uncharacterized protein LOC119699143 [Motacilla alba alba]